VKLDGIETVPGWHWHKTSIQSAGTNVKFSLLLWYAGNALRILQHLRNISPKWISSRTALLVYCPARILSLCSRKPLKESPHAAFYVEPDSLATCGRVIFNHKTYTILYNISTHNLLEPDAAHQVEYMQGEIVAYG
jgi:hypothetical protein